MKGSAFAQRAAGTVLTLRNRVVPMLRAAMLTEQHVVVTRHVSSCVYIAPVGLQIFIHDHAIRHFNSTVRQRLCDRLHADTRHDHVARHDLAAFAIRPIQRCPGPFNSTTLLFLANRTPRAV